MTGLNESAICPECGCTDPTTRSAHRRWTLVQDRLPIGAAALVAFVGWYGVEAAVAHTWLALSYYFDGHPWDVSNAAAFGRGPRADDLPLLFLPFWSAVTLSPLAAFESRPRHRWITFAMIIGMGAIATIAFRYEYFASR